MMIDKIGGISPLNNLQKTRQTESVKRADVGSDSISVSAEAREMYFLNQVAAETPDVRADKVAAIKEKIKDPSYLNDAVIMATADRIIEAYGI